MFSVQKKWQSIPKNIHWGEKKSIEAIPKKDKMIDIVDKDFKTTPLMPKKITEVTEKVKKMIYGRDENMNKGIDIIKRNQKEILDGTEK